jgi:hypothetical protein
MGTEHYVACRDCKKVRGLGKFPALAFRAETRSEASDLTMRLVTPENTYRFVLLGTFLWAHRGHNCTVFSDQDDECMDMVPVPGEPCEYEDDSDKFWLPPQRPPRGKGIG